MDEPDARMTQAIELEFHHRLAGHFGIPGRLDEAIVFLNLEEQNIIHNSAASTLARNVCNILMVRTPPELLRLAKLLERWEKSHQIEIPLPVPPPPVTPHFSTAEKIAILGPQIVLGLMIANVSLAALSLCQGRSLVEVVALWLGLTSMTLASVYACSRFTQAPKSIPEAQFIMQAHQGRMDYAAKGLLDHPAGRRAALTATDTSEAPRGGRSAPLKSVPPILCVASGKGGVGKTSLSLCLASEVARSRRVLLIDLDYFNRGATGLLREETFPLVDGLPLVEALPLFNPGEGGNQTFDSKPPFAWTRSVGTNEPPCSAHARNCHSRSSAGCTTGRSRS